MRPFHMNRRQALRGALASSAIAVGLPLLDCMLNDSGTALAQGAPIPKRVGIWFWGNGVRPEHWFPDADSAAWDPALKQHTKPLSDAGLTEYVSLVSGTRLFSNHGQAHHDGKNIVLTGTWDWLDGRADLGYGRALGPSIDRIAAEKWKGLTPFDSLELGVQEGYANKEAGNAGHFTSTNGPDSYNRPQTSPHAVFRRLFGAGPDPSAQLAQNVATARKSILDAVLDDAQKLQPRLGVGDRARLELHMDAIRSLERRLTEPPAGGACETPLMPFDDYPAVNGRQPLRGRNESMSQLLALALACDLTRAFTYQFTVFQTANVFSEVDVQQEEFHEYSHDPGAVDDVRKVTNYTMENLAATLTALRNTPEGDGNLLDNCAIMCTTEHTEPMSHSADDLPMIIAGRAGGKLKGGVYYDGNDERISKAGLTVMRAAGLQIDSFGENNEFAEPQTTETFTALET